MMIEKSGYIDVAKASWERAWTLLTDAEHWHLECGKDSTQGCVFTKHFNKSGKVFKLKATLDFGVDEVFDVLVPGVEEWPIWNPTILDCKMLEIIDENTDISYNVGASAAGGLVASRDFVNLRHWKSRDGVLMSSACHVVHSDMPVTKKHVRAENKPACYAFESVEGDPNKCVFTCILSTDLKGWMPQFLIDQALSGVLMDYLKHLRRHLASRKKAQGSA